MDGTTSLHRHIELKDETGCRPCESKLQRGGAVRKKKKDVAEKAEEPKRCALCRSMRRATLSTSS